MARVAPILLAASLLVVAAPLAFAQSASTGCSSGIGAGFSSCSFECFEGQSLSASMFGYGFAHASCGGAHACSLGVDVGPYCQNGPTNVQYDGFGSCDAYGYVWISYECSAS